MLVTAAKRLLEASIRLVLQQCPVLEIPEKVSSTLIVFLRLVLTLPPHKLSATGRTEHEAIIRELDSQMEKLKADRQLEVAKKEKERRERTEEGRFKQNTSKKRDRRKEPDAKRYNNARQTIYLRKRRAEDAYEEDFPDYSERRTTPKELQKHKYIPKVGRGAAERARRGRTK